MKRTAFDDRQDQRIADEFSSRQFLCCTCRRLTDGTELAEFGARCGACYEAYCRAAPSGPIPRNTAEKRAILERLRAVMAQQSKDPKNWAYRLRDREARGDRLTPFQREAWRNALRLPITEAA